MRMREMTYLEAIRAGLQHVLRTQPETLLFGEDVAAFGGAFKMTLGFLEEFGPQRIFNTPISESAILGVAMGMATQGRRPIVELQFSDFGTNALHQLLNNAGTFHYRTGVPVPMVVRAPCGGGFGGGPFHSEELEAFFCHMPGIKVVYPSFPSDARGLLVSAVADQNPVVYLENKYLYRRIKEQVSDRVEAVPMGAARVVRSGREAAIITYGAMVHEALRAADQVRTEHGYEVLVLDLRTLKPCDEESILAAVAATSRAMVVHEGWRTSGFGAEIAALIVEKAFHLLDAPVSRITAPDTPVPFAPELESAFRPGAQKIAEALVELIEY